MNGSLLDESYEAMTKGKVEPALTLLYGGMNELRTQLSPRQWRAVIDESLDHPLREIVHQDPLTARCFRAAQDRRPDYTALDYIFYRQPHDPSAVTDVGKRVFHYTTNAAIARAIRWRRVYVGRLLNTLAERVVRPNVLAIEPGCLREAELSYALMSGQFGDFVSLDDNVAGLTRILRNYGEHGVRTVHGSARAVAAGEQTLADFGFRELDLVYAPTLFNLLPAQEAACLLKEMWRAVRAGGYIYFSNVLTGLADAAFLDCYAGWQFCYRTPTEIGLLLENIRSSTFGGFTLTYDPDRAMAFVVVQKAV